MSRKSLGSQEDIQAGRDAAEGSGVRNFLSIPDRKTPWYILDKEFTDGFVHWVELPNGRKQRVVCAGDPETSGGFAPDDCPLCEYMMAGYQRNKKLCREGETKKGTAIKEAMNDMRAGYEAHFIAVRGERILVESASGKKGWSADFDDSDDESEVEIGILSLSHAQYTGMTDMADDDDIKHVKSGLDLFNRVLWTEKVKVGKRRYKEVKWHASLSKTDMPELELPEDLTVDEDFDLDEEMLEKVHALLTGEGVEDIDEDEEVEVEVESDSGDEPEDADLDDVGEEEVAEEEAVSDADFQDDLPWEDGDEEETIVEEEEPEPPPRTRKKQTSTARSRGSTAQKGTKDNKTTARKSKTGATNKTRSGSSGKAKSGTSSTRAGSSTGKSRSKSGTTTKGKGKTSTKKTKSGRTSL